MALDRSIAVAQTVPIRGDVGANTAQHLRLVRLAAREHAQVLVLPELSLTGYEMGLARDLAFSEQDPRLAPLLDAAADAALTLIVGAPVRIESRLHIGAFVLGPDRSIRLYTKQRMGAFSDAARVDGVVPPAEATVFEPGDRDPLLELGGASAALAVCADIGRATHPERAAARGASVYLASMFLIPSEFEGDAAKLQRYATQHAMLVAAANFGGPSGGLAAAGRSTIWSECGDIVVQLDASGAGVAVARPDGATWRGTRLMDAE